MLCKQLSHHALVCGIGDVGVEFCIGMISPPVYVTTVITAPYKRVAMNLSDTLRRRS
jgi:hypothetical protein